MRPLFDYVDYREFLKDYYEFKKLTQAGFSHRYFLAKAGLKGPNFLKNVIDRKKSLSSISIPQFAKALELNKKESEYFAALVLFNQAKQISRKQFYFNQLSEFATQSNAQQIQKNQMAYFSNWYNVVVREFIHCNFFTGDFEALAHALYPQITPRQAEKAVDLLLELNLIRKDNDNVFRLTSNIMTTGPEIKSMGVREYHRNMIEISKQAIDDIPLEKRYYRTITGSFSEDTFEKIKLEVDSARRKILALIESDQGPRKVFQINMQLFPLQSNLRKRNKNKDSRP
ncbi:MAG: hypothetical protein A2293_11090 [Elusimicrobia bacterium RIFOXYB2_FULL_49_7]|nr:MAG: hypothetical protein A2293_11090 [Elusimicrobia bacterium RIFOXYB2_FULL_49_7]